MMIVGALAVFLGLLSMGLMVIAPTFTTAGNRRLRAMDEYVASGRAKGPTKSVTSPSAISEQILDLSDKLTRERKATAKTAMLLERADLAFRTNEWYVLRMVAVVVTAATAWLVFHSSVVTGMLSLVGGLLVGFFAPQMFLSFMAKHRATQVRDSVAGRLDTSCQQLGHGVLPGSGDRCRCPGRIRALGQGVLASPG